MAEFTLDEKIEVIDDLITQWRIARNSATGERDIYLILKAIAKDLRARKSGSPGRARDRLARAIGDAKDLKTGDGYRARDLVRIAETAISEWPVIRQALEDFEQRIKTDG